MTICGSGRGQNLPAALNIFTSLGYGDEEDDLRILRDLSQAVRPGGMVFVETHHRDALMQRLPRLPAAGQRLPDGTLLLEEPKFDPVSGRVNTNWYWSGPAGSGQKSGSLRLYTATELIGLMEAADLRIESVFSGCSLQPFEMSVNGVPAVSDAEA